MSLSTTYCVSLNAAMQVDLSGIRQGLTVEDVLSASGARIDKQSEQERKILSAFVELNYVMITLAHTQVNFPSSTAVERAASQTAEPSRQYFLEIDAPARSWAK